MIANLLSVPLNQLPSLPLAGFWFGDAASTTAENVDWQFNFITWVSTVVFVMVVITMIAFAWRYRMRPGHAEQPSPSHNNAVEVTWTVIPILIFMAIFFLGFVGFLDMRNPPDDAYEINVIASKWKWQFKYPNGLISGELHVPVDRPIKLIQESRDVLHSLYIPAFRIKMDVVPGRYTYQWFEANKIGTYDLFCAEYCGKDHSNMYTVVIVESEEDFETFLNTDIFKDMPDEEAGAKLYSYRGCASCHSVDGTAVANGGPTFKGAFGTTVPLTDGSTVLMDENYIRESLLQPMAKIHQGYEPRMPSFQGSLNDDDIRRIVAYIKSLKD